jgi:hypothetical protein
LLFSAAGGFAAFFSNPARSALMIVLFAQVGAALFTPGNASSSDRDARRHNASSLTIQVDGQ